VSCCLSGLHSARRCLGHGTLGLHSIANPGDWIEADDFALTRD